MIVEEPYARPAVGSTGLYHLALLVPCRVDLARWLAHAALDRIPLVGLSDHFVSEALYLSDPDGHGIAIYWDRPREVWEDQVAAHDLRRVLPGSVATALPARYCPSRTTERGAPIMSTDPGSADTGRTPRLTVASYDDYLDAQRAVDWLSDQGFSVERVAIVGSGLRSVEQVTGRVTTGRAALTGAGQGALIGLIFALLFGLFFVGPGFIGLLVYALIVGALLGAALGAIAHAALGGERDFASIGRLRADRYELVVDAEVADQASNLLGRMPGPDPELTAS